MKYGYVKVAAGTPDLKVADCEYNTDRILEMIGDMKAEGVKVMVFPELCITGYSCRDLFLQRKLIDSAKEQLRRIIIDTADVDALILVGLPVSVRGKLYNVAAVLNRGSNLGFVPKQNIPMYNEFYEGRQFTRGHGAVTDILWDGHTVMFGANQIFRCSSMPGLALGVEICEDLWGPHSPGTEHAIHGATLIANLSASNDIIGKAGYRRDLVKMESARAITGYIYASAGIGESTTDLVFGGHDIIAEYGAVLSESKRFENGFITAEIDVERLEYERRRMSTYPDGEDHDVRMGASPEAMYIESEFELEKEETRLTRSYPAAPFVPGNAAEREERCQEILNIQSHGLARRLRHIGAKRAVIGISGGLDSTLALLVTVRAFDLLGLDRKGICAITMPCFGTTDRTYRNACTLIKELGADFHEIPIREAVNQHFKDIGQDPQVFDVTFENCQARERTQVLMDMSNKIGGIVVGTGDLSELALGWATYNGDHMSMYAVNSSVPKTLVSYLVKYYADTTDNEKVNAVLRDILDTPISPELIPPSEDGEIVQKTEDKVGPYELHDFFLFYMLRAGFEPEKILYIAEKTFAGRYSRDELVKWLENFYRRFFSQQYKRSCMPDGPKVGSVAFSPRGDLRMPSDAAVKIWMDSIRK